MKRKILICVLVVMLCVVGTGLTVYAVSRENAPEAIIQTDPAMVKSIQEAKEHEEIPPIDASDDIYIAQGDKSDLLNDNPEPIFGNNEELDAYYDIEKSIDRDYLKSVGAEVTVKSVMTYREYCEKFDDASLTALDSNRLVWVLQIKYPNGFETKRGIFMNATVTGIYDAESGFYFGYNVTDDCKE